MKTHGYNKVYRLWNQVRTNTLGMCGACNKSLVTSAAVASDCVLTPAIPADAGFSWTLIQI